MPEPIRPTDPYALDVALIARTPDWPDPGSLEFVWHGGAYIDVRPADAETATTVINGWDYERGRPTIRVTIAGLRARVAAWLDEVGADEA
ncbi:MAG TPA: hypothetical protein VMW47_11015 [Verrucomicrobiae bacterium]|nr:hypothetical protein [Verrucomicrobiae bacterium]